MKAASYKDMTETELLERAKELRQGLFNLRVRNTTKELQNTSQIRRDKRELARVLTAISAKRGAEEPVGAAG